MGINWIALNDLSQISEIRDKSFKKPQVIFKHSTSCTISSMAKNRLEKITVAEEKSADFYYLDLLNHRSISNEVAENFSVFHESPQVLLIQKGETIYEESHYGISKDELLESIFALSKI